MRRRGGSLVELLVAAAIVAVLLGLSVTAYAGALGHVRAKMAGVQVKYHLAAAEALYSGD